MDRTIANILASFSLIFGNLTWMIQHQDSLIKWLTLLISGITCFFCGRYYYYAAKEKKQNLK